MEYEIYIDVFVLTSFVMDLLALFLTDVFLGRDRGVKKLILPSFLGTCIGIFLFFVLHNYDLYAILLHFLVNPCMVWMTFRDKTKRDFLESWGVTYLMVLLAGGIMQWLYQTLFHGRYRMPAMGLTVALGLIAAGIWRYYMELGKRIYQVQLFMGNKMVDMKAYYDTGNLLMDPYVKKPVSIVAVNAIEPLVEKGELHSRLIPYTSLGENHGLLEVYTLEKMLIYKGKRVITVMPVAIGVADKRLFTQGGYQMILNSHLL